MTSTFDTKCARRSVEVRHPWQLGRVLLLGLLAITSGPPAHADLIPGPPLYDGPLLLLTPSSQGEDSLPEHVVQQIAPATRVVLSAHGLHVLLSETRSGCFASECIAVFVAQKDGARSVSRPVKISRTTTVYFSEDADDTDECYGDLAFRKGIRVYVRNGASGVEAWLGTAVPCVGSNVDLSYDYDLAKVPHVDITARELDGQEIPSEAGDEISYQVNGEAFKIDLSEFERRLLREEGR